MMFDRLIAQEIREELAEMPSVAILGPRQVGKTTLAIEIAHGQPSLYLDLENPEDFQKLSDPVSYLRVHADKLVVLDEVQRYPGLFRTLRGIIDEGRRKGRGNGRFLLLGSASNDLLQQSAESLAGRISYLQLTGFTPQEVEAETGDALKALWARGGFPGSFGASSQKASTRWRNSFISTYLERDIPQLGPRIPAATLRRFWTMLAHTQGELFNASKLASALGVQSVTISRYLDLMVDLMLVRRLEPWHGNVKKRLVKSPRTYVRDSGLLHTLLQIPDYDRLLGHPVFGKSWEGFVFEIILGYLPATVRPSFYRTAVGAEIDLVLEFEMGEYWAIEIKATPTPKLQKGFHIACEDLKVKRKWVIYTGEETFPMGNDITALSLQSFTEELKNYLS
ncbi:MAG: ATP-binding protein [Salibacteraceae bacterium]